MRQSDFEWDAEKNRENIKKHGVAFEQAQLVFADPNRVIAEDLSHSFVEKRYYCFGMIEEGVVTVRFTHRADKMRIFGAGFWRKGKEIYEKQNKIQR